VRPTGSRRMPFFRVMPRGSVFSRSCRWGSEAKRVSRAELRRRLVGGRKREGGPYLA